MRTEKNVRETLRSSTEGRDATSLRVDLNNELLERVLFSSSLHGSAKELVLVERRGAALDLDEIALKLGGIAAIFTEVAAELMHRYEIYDPFKGFLVEGTDEAATEGDSSG